MKMKCLSIHQPWASLLAVEAKRVETRHWPVRPAWVEGQRIAIHAAKNKRSLDLVGAPVFRDRLKAALDAKTLVVDDVGDLPLGCIVATARLVSCEPMGDDFAERFPRDELVFGNFAPERWAWRFDQVARCPLPIEYRGQQGVFELDEVTSRELLKQATAVAR